MTSNVSYANGNILRGLNLVGFTLPSSNYQTAYYDVSGFSNYSISASTNTPGLSISIIESIDASGDPSSERLVGVATLATPNVLEALGGFSTKSRFLSLQLSGSPGSIINTQVLFQ